jgi:aminoglycoside 6'-N-acetyltransferase
LSAVFDITFRSMTSDDFELLHRWLQNPHVKAWFREDDSLEEVIQHYSPSIRGDDPTQLFIVQRDGQDVGFMEMYKLLDYEEWSKANVHVVPDQEGIVGIDYLIGEETLIGNGLGSRVIGEFCRQIFTDPSVRGIISDPQTENVASCRVLEKNRFVPLWRGKLASNHPSDSGESTVYFLDRKAFVS